MQVLKKAGLFSAAAIVSLATLLTGCSSQPSESDAIQVVWDGMDATAKTSNCTWSDTSQLTGGMADGQPLLDSFKQMDATLLVSQAQKTNPNLDESKLYDAAFALLDKVCELGRVTG